MPRSQVVLARMFVYEQTAPLNVLLVAVMPLYSLVPMLSAPVMVPPVRAR